MKIVITKRTKLYNLMIFFIKMKIVITKLTILYNLMTFLN